MNKKYIPFALRQTVPKKQLPKRKVLSKDFEMMQYHREILLLYIDLAVDTSERLLDADIPLMERAKVQEGQNNLYKISEAVKRTLSNKTEGMHEDRVEFVTEMVALCTLVKPAWFKRLQSRFGEQVKRTNKIR